MNTGYEELKQANEAIITTNIKGKDYAPVNQRLKAFRMVHPRGMIVTDMVGEENGTVTFKAIIYDEERRTLATGYAQEKAGSSNINKTSHIENCETSAVGRALGFAGFGIDVSVSSSEEVDNADKKQQEITRREEDELRRKVDALEFVTEEDGGKPLTSVQYFCLKNLLDEYGVPVEYVLSLCRNTKSLEEMPQATGVSIKADIQRIAQRYQKSKGE